MNSQQVSQADLPFWIRSYPQGIVPTIDGQIDQYSSVLDVFEEACANFANRLAFTNMGKSFTYSELNRMAETFAAFLQNEFKLKKGDRIAIQMPNLLQYPVVMYGALKAGLIIVNTNPLYTEREMCHQFKDSGAVAIVIVANYAKHLQSILQDTQIRHVIVTEIGDMLSFPKKLLVNFVVKHVKKMVPDFSLPEAVTFASAMARGASMTYHRPQLTLEEIAFLQYTGGTTGVSKGAMLTHRNIVSNMEQIYLWIRPTLEPGKEVAICALPLYHIFSMTLHGLTLLKLGCENVIITNPRDIPGFIKELKARRFTVMSGVNTLFNGLMNNKDFDSVDFSHVKVSVAGGMALQTAVAKRWKERTKSLIVEGYGLTETSPVACVNPLNGTDRVGTIGLPVPSTLVKMLDDSEQEVALGQPGELSIKGPQVMKGYWQKPEETAKVMTKDGYFKTGDVGVMDPDGFCKIVDRKKDMILVSGFNVYPNEVEDVIAMHPKVLEVAAIGVENEHSGEVVKVFIVKKDQSLTAEEVIAFARESLTSYKAPKLVEFRKELPKTNVGKILRRALKEPAKT